jgi:NTP pyrophosphatase (non-canonical NTP hydrolase)
MEAQLRANDHKPGWKNDSLLSLISRCSEELIELRHEIIEEYDPVRVLKEAADVANFAMMIADVCGGLISQQQRKPEEGKK